MSLSLVAFLRSFIRYQWLSIAWAVLIFILCNLDMGQSEDKPGFLFKGFDKLAHTGFYFVLTLFMLRGRLAAQRQPVKVPALVKIVLLAVIYGGIIELLQWKIFTWRSGDWWDFFCNTTGIFMAVASYKLLFFERFNEKIS